MKKHIYLFMLVFTSVNFIFAQLPDSINYQAVIRNADGTLIAQGKTVNFKFSVTLGTSNYTETQLYTINNKLGLANLKIGAGVASSSGSKLINLPWANGNAILEVFIDTTGGTSFNSISNTSLVTVPYAYYSDRANKASTSLTANFATNASTAAIANSIANLSFNVNTDSLTIGNKSTLIPLKDTVVGGLNVLITPTTRTTGTKYEVKVEPARLSVSNAPTPNTLLLATNGVTNNTITFTKGAGININSTANNINFSIDNAYIKDTLKSITRVRFDNNTNKTYIYTPLPKLKLDTITSLLTIQDSLKLLTNSVNLSYLTNKNTKVKIAAGAGILVNSTSLGNEKTYTVTNRFPADSIRFLTSGGRTIITGTYPNYKVYSDTNIFVPYTLSNSSNNLALSINNSPTKVINVIESNKLKRTGNRISSKINNPSTQPSKTNDSTDIIDGIIHIIKNNNLTTTINGINSNQLSIFDTITLKMPLLYNDIVINGQSNKTFSPILKTQPINTFLAASANSNTSTPTFRKFESSDLAHLNVVQYYDIAPYSTTGNNASPTNMGSFFTKFADAPKHIANSKLFEVNTPIASPSFNAGYIGWNTTTPQNTFVIKADLNDTASFQLTNATNTIGIKSGFVAKFDGTNTLLSTKNDMLFTDNLVIPSVRLKLSSTNVFVGDATTPIALNLSKDLITNGTPGNNNDVLTSQGPGLPAQWKPAVGANIWRKIGNTIFESTPNDNLTLGNNSNINNSVKLAVVSGNLFDTAIYARSLGKHAIIGETTDNSKITYAIKGITNGAGTAALQSSTSTFANYSAGIFGESNTTTTNITYGIMGKTSSINDQAAGIFGIANVGRSDGVRGISVGSNRGNAASFFNYANGNSSPTVLISNRDLSDSAAALHVEGGQVVKTRFVTAINSVQTKGDYIIIVQNTANLTQTLTLLNPSLLPIGTVVIIRYIKPATASAGNLIINTNGTNSSINLYSKDFVLSTTISVISASSITTTDDSSFSLVAVGNSWIEW